MKKLLFFAISALVLISCQSEKLNELNNVAADVPEVSAQVIPGKYVVVYNSTGIKQAARIASLTGNGVISPENVITMTKEVLASSKIDVRTPSLAYASALKGVAINLTEEEAVLLAKSQSVKGVYPDMMVNFGLPEAVVSGKPTTPAVQSTPWGITRIGGSSDGTGKTAWIIDTGIDMNHPDLKVSQTLGRNFVTIGATPEDDNGHGTHCAGIVAALNNSQGVIGVAAGATVVPIKVLNRKGSGAYSAIIAGVDYVSGTAKAGDAVNMSLGGPIYTPLDDAIMAMAAKGIKVALAAGNESQDANNVSPAHINGPNIYTISAMGTSDAWASYSNFGNPPVDYCAPGSSIYSTYKGDTYATLSGTSMATPHVCGLLLLGTIRTDGYVSGDPDKNADPIAHK